MMEKVNLRPCPLCGGKVHATYEGSSEWSVHHLDDSGERLDYDFTCVGYFPIWVRASDAEWSSDDNAEWNKMAEKWNRRVA